MDITLGREKKIRLNIMYEGKNMKEKVQKRLKQKSDACKQKEGGLVADVKQDCRLIPENKG